MKRFGRHEVWFLFFVILFTGVSCNRSDDNNQFGFERMNRDTPDFFADSAYYFIEKQLSFGPRNPGSEGHALTRDYLVEQLSLYAGSSAVYVQHFDHVGYEGRRYEMANIMASFRPEMTDRVMLLAHWDTRPRADREKDPKRRFEPIPGADDGGSGVAVLLEMTRMFQQKPPPVGVDIILFDGEDYGHEGDLAFYFLGSRYWSDHPPVPGYRPRYGILLDMVGAHGAVFPRERFSDRYAKPLVDEVWEIAEKLGYDHLFLNKRGSAIADDHWIINKKTGIPTINIIHHKVPRFPNEQVQFPDYWHTHNDDLDIIDVNTLQAVGDVLTEMIYNRIR